MRYFSMRKDSSSLASESAKFTNALRIPYFEFDKKL